MHEQITSKSVGGRGETSTSLCITPRGRHSRGFRSLKLWIDGQDTLPGFSAIDQLPVGTVHGRVHKSFWEQGQPSAIYNPPNPASALVPVLLALGNIRYYLNQNA